MSNPCSYLDLKVRIGNHVLINYFDIISPHSYQLFSSFSVPQQINGFDCGVFVCRYAYGLYQIALLQ
jgi:hypothetical protein